MATSNVSLIRSKTVSFTDFTTGQVIPGMPTPAPCPFCRKHRGNAIQGDVGDENTPALFHVDCSYCGAEGPPGKTLLEAAQLWNAATVAAPSTACREELDGIERELLMVLPLVDMLHDVFGHGDDVLKESIVSDSLSGVLFDVLNRVRTIDDLTQKAISAEVSHG